MKKNRLMHGIISLVLLSGLLFLSSCQPTYKKENFIESVKLLAQKEYQLDVDVAVSGSTLGARFHVLDLMSEMYSGNDEIYRKMNGLFTILARVGLSSDISPDFIVLDIVDEGNPDFQIIFTRHMVDVRKSMAEALSYSDSQDRLIQEFVINGKRILLDPEEMDFLRLMIMAADSDHKNKTLPEFRLTEVKLDQFLPKVIENSTKRFLREKKNMKEDIQIRDVAARFYYLQDPKNKFQLALDLMARPQGPLSGSFVEKNILPFLAKEVGSIFKSYRFDAFSDITVTEKNSGATLTIPAH